MPISEYDPTLTRECMDTACGDSGVCLALEGAQNYFNNLAARRIGSVPNRIRMFLGMKVPVQAGLGAYVKMSEFTARAHANNCPYKAEVNQITGQNVVE